MCACTYERCESAKLAHRHAAAEYYHSSARAARHNPQIRSKTFEATCPPWTCFLSQKPFMRLTSFNPFLKGQHIINLHVSTRFRLVGQNALTPLKQDLLSIYVVIVFPLNFPLSQYKPNILKWFPASFP